MRASQALDAGSIPVIRSTPKVQVKDCPLETWTIVVRAPAMARAISSPVRATGRPMVLVVVLARLLGAVMRVEQSAQPVGDQLVRDARHMLVDQRAT